MEPKLPMPLSSPEMGGYKPPEIVKQPGLHSVESGQDIQERAERHEISQQAPSAAPVAPILPQAPAVPINVAVPQVQPVIDDNPISAKDEELIEKEWVDKAKKIVQATKSDPYTQEDKVSKLQADYIKKRYGKEIKLANN